MGIWNAFLVGLGIRPCCDKQKLKSNSNLPEYYEHECENCGRILYIAERLGIASTADPVAGDATSAPAPPSGDHGADSEAAAASPDLSPG